MLQGLKLQLGALLFGVGKLLQSLGAPLFGMGKLLHGLGTTLLGAGKLLLHQLAQLL